MWATWVKQKGRFVSTPGSKASLSNYRSPSRDLGVEQNNCASLKVGSGAWRRAKPIRLSCRWTYFTVRSPPPKLALLTMKFTLLSRFTASLETFCNSKWRDGWWDVLVSQIFRQSTRSTRCFVLFVSFYNGSQTKDALVLHTAPRSTKVVWAAAGISPRLSVCFQTYPQVWQRPLRSNPVDLLSTLYFMTLKDEMPSLPSLRSWNNALSFPVWGYRSMISIRGTQTLQNMGLNSDLCFIFFLPNLLPVLRSLSAPSAAAQPLVLRLFTSGPLGGFQTQRVWQSISGWGYLIRAHDLRPDLDTGLSVIGAWSRDEVERSIQIQDI